MKAKEIIGHMKRKVKIPRKVRIIFDIFEWIIFIFLLGLFSLLLLPILPTKRYITSYVIPTGSMVPTIAVGSLAFVTPNNTSLHVSQGSIIAFTDPQNQQLTVLHRVVRVEKTATTIEYKTKGDHNNGLDPWTVSPAQVKGEYLFSLAYLGYVSAFVRSAWGFGLLIILPSLVLILLQIKKIKEGIEEEVVKRTKIVLDKKDVSLEMITFLLGIGLLTLLSLPASIHQAHAIYTTTVGIQQVGFGVKDYTSPQLSLDEDDDEKSLFYTLQHIGKYKSLSYFLTYDTDSVPQGVSGTIPLDGKDDFTSFPITLGTCSSGVCTYNNGIHHVQLTVTLHGDSQTKTLQKTL